MLREYAGMTPIPEFGRYVERNLKRPGNLDTGRLLSLVDSFSEQWHTALDAFLTAEHRAAITSVYTNRNTLAHGGDVDLTYREITTYYARVRETVDFLDTLVP